MSQFSSRSQLESAEVELAEITALPEVSLSREFQEALDCSHVDGLPDSENEEAPSSPVMWAVSWGQSSVLHISMQSLLAAIFALIWLLFFRITNAFPAYRALFGAVAAVPQAFFVFLHYTTFLRVDPDPLYVWLRRILAFVAFLLVVAVAYAYHSTAEVDYFGEHLSEFSGSYLVAVVVEAVVFFVLAPMLVLLTSETYRGYVRDRRSEDRCIPTLPSRENDLQCPSHHHYARNHSLATFPVYCVSLVCLFGGRLWNLWWDASTWGVASTVIVGLITGYTLTFVQDSRALKRKEQSAVLFRCCLALWAVNINVVFGSRLMMLAHSHHSNIFPQMGVFLVYETLAHIFQRLFDGWTEASAVPGPYASSSGALAYFFQFFCTIFSACLLMVAEITWSLFWAIFIYRMLQFLFTQIPVIWPNFPMADSVRHRFAMKKDSGEYNVFRLQTLDQFIISEICGVVVVSSIVIVDFWGSGLPGEAAFPFHFASPIEFYHSVLMILLLSFVKVRLRVWSFRLHWNVANRGADVPDNYKQLMRMSWVKSFYVYAYATPVATLQVFQSFREAAFNSM